MMLVAKSSLLACASPQGELHLVGIVKENDRVAQAASGPVVDLLEVGLALRLQSGVVWSAPDPGRRARHPWPDQAGSRRCRRCPAGLWIAAYCAAISADLHHGGAVDLAHVVVTAHRRAAGWRSRPPSRSRRPGRPRLAQSATPRRVPGRPPGTAGRRHPTHRRRRPRRARWTGRHSSCGGQVHDLGADLGLAGGIDGKAALVVIVHHHRRAGDR